MIRINTSVMDDKKWAVSTDERIDILEDGDHVEFEINGDQISVPLIKLINFVEEKGE